MVIRLVAVPDYLELADFDDVFHAVLGWESGIGYAFQVHGQEFNSFRRRTRAKRLRDFGLHRQEKFLYTLGAMDQFKDWVEKKIRRHLMRARNRRGFGWRRWSRQWLYGYLAFLI
jgi:hypothetical protein